jgi:hypothetical protein
MRFSCAGPILLAYQVCNLDGLSAALTPPRLWNGKAEIIQGVLVLSGAFVVHASRNGKCYFTDPFQRKVDKPSTNGRPIRIRVASGPPVRHRATISINRFLSVFLVGFQRKEDMAAIVEQRIIAPSA